MTTPVPPDRTSFKWNEGKIKLLRIFTEESGKRLDFIRWVVTTLRYRNRSSEKQSIGGCLFFKSQKIKGKLLLAVPLWVLRGGWAAKLMKISRKAKDLKGKHVRFQLAVWMLDLETFVRKKDLVLCWVLISFLAMVGALWVISKPAKALFSCMSHS